jgi:hypothetical protein
MRSQDSITDELNTGSVAEHLLNNRLQMRVSSANGKVVTLTKHVQTGQGELANHRQSSAMAQSITKTICASSRPGIRFG